jgi:hypothetical protein
MGRRKLAVALAAALAVSVALPSMVLATKPHLTCPSADSGHFVVDRDEWWSRTVAGFEAEGIPVYNEDGSFTDEFDDFSADAGFGSGQGLYDFVWGPQWDGMDKNDNGFVCMKDRPHTPGNPAFFFNGVDDQSSTKQGESA